MAKNDQKATGQVTAGGAQYGPGEGESAADAFVESTGPSRDAKDYVLVTKYVGDGLRIEEQVLKSDLEESDEYKGTTLNSDNVVEAHPAANRPTSDLTEEEAKQENREQGQG